jgi:WD40 repeat protein
VGGFTDQVTIWDVKTRSKLVAVSHPDWVRGVALSPDGTQLATASDRRTVKIWDAHSGKLVRTLEGHAHFCTAVAYSPDSTRLASASSDGAVILWDAATGRELQTLSDMEGWLRTLAFSRDGKRLAAGEVNSGTLRVWDLTRVPR